MPVLQSGSPNPVQQIIFWAIEIVDQIAANWGTVGTVLGLAMGVYLLLVLYRTWIRGEDTSIRYRKETDAGAASVQLTGTHVTLTLVTGIALVTWPLPIDSPEILLSLLLAVTGHYYVEKTGGTA